MIAVAPYYNTFNGGTVSVGTTLTKFRRPQIGKHKCRRLTIPEQAPETRKRRERGQGRKAKYIDIGYSMHPFVGTTGPARELNQGGAWSNFVIPETLP